MRIAVAYDNGKVAQRFGRANEFKIYAIHEGRILRSKVFEVEDKEEGHGARVILVNKSMCDAVICGNLGPLSHEALYRFDIAVYAGVEGDPDQAVQDMLDGKLEPLADPEIKESEGCGSCS